jgi:protoporphyrinogen oxidase
MVTIRGGLYRVPEGIAAKLPVRYRARVTQISEHGTGVEVRYADAAGATRTVHADHCIVSAQYDDAAGIFPGLAKYAGDFGQQLKFCRLVDLKLGYGAATKSKAYLAQAATRESPDLMMFALVHNKAADRAPPGHSLFTIYTDDAVWDRFVAMSDEAIVSWGRERIERWYPELKGHFLFGHVSREARTACFASPGFYRRTTKLFADLAPSRVQLAGDMFGAGSMEAAVVWGEKAADRVLSGADQSGRPAVHLKAA